MERPWLNSYPAGVPDKIGFSCYPSAAALFEESFSKYRSVLTCRVRTWAKFCGGSCGMTL